jgi:hypothetical protein
MPCKALPCQISAAEALFYGWKYNANLLKAGGVQKASLLRDRVILRLRFVYLRSDVQRPRKWQSRGGYAQTHQTLGVISFPGIYTA